MKKLIYAVLIFVACQCIAMLLISDINFTYNSEEVDMEFEGHDYLIFTENGRTINVLHDLDCDCIVK